MKIRYYYEKEIKEIEKPLENIETGRECIVKGVKTSPHVKSNPGQFDYMQYLANQNIQAELLVNNLEDISCGKKSEENTSELQSRGQLVCRLLLEKKKIKIRKSLI